MVCKQQKVEVVNGEGGGKGYSAIPGVLSRTPAQRIFPVHSICVPLSAILYKSIIWHYMLTSYTIYYTLFLLKVCIESCFSPYLAHPRRVVQRPQRLGEGHGGRQRVPPQAPGGGDGEEAVQGVLGAGQLGGGRYRFFIVLKGVLKCFSG